jgi:carbon monoxide dehydrogenase subunit G
MGGCSSSSVVTGFATLEIEAPAETVWATIADLEASPVILQAVASFERTGGGDFEVGTKWLETRVHLGRDVVLHKTITAIVNDENNKERSVSIVVNYTAANPQVQDAVSTNTLTVIPINASSCQLMVTVAFSTPKLWRKIERTLCLCCIRRIASRLMGKNLRADLSDYETAATKREQERRMTSEKSNNANEKKDAAADS